MLSIKQLKDGFANTPQVLKLVWSSSKPATFALASFTLVSSMLPLAVAWVGKRIVDSVVAHHRDATIQFVLIELLLVAISALMGRLSQLVQSQLGARLVIDIHLLILRKALQLELKHFENHDFYDMLMRARNEASMRPVSILTESFRLVQNTLTLAGFVILLIRFSPWAVLGLILAAVPATIAEMYYSREAFRLRHWRSPERRRLNYVEYVLANDGHVKEVKLLNLGPALLERYRTMSEQFYREDQKVATRRAGWGYVLSLIGTAGFYGCYVWMAIDAATGALTLGNMTLYIMAFREGQRAFQTTLGAIGDMYEDSLYLSNLFAYLAIPTFERKALPPPSGTTTTTEVLNQPGIRFENVGFKYPFPEDSNWVFRNLNLTIPAGQALALVGPNGAGKTTLIKLMTGMYEPTEGRVLLDGKEVRAWDPEALHKRFSAVFQDFNRYQFTARENVGIGSEAHKDDEPQIARALDKGGAAELVANLPRGLDTQLGTWFKGGTELSGGQWQKLALARTFMREDSDILILDEPTAALDAETEHAVFERFKNLAHGRTTILISHRFPTVRMADRIIVLENGQIIEEGTHAALIANNQRYAQLFTLQASGYQ